MCCPALTAAVSVPFIVVIKFEGDKLKAERIYWDQVGVLAHKPSLLSHKLTCVQGLHRRCSWYAWTIWFWFTARCLNAIWRKAHAG